MFITSLSCNRSRERPKSCSGYMCDSPEIIKYNFVNMVHSTTMLCEIIVPSRWQGVANYRISSALQGTRLYHSFITKLWGGMTAAGICDAIRIWAYDTLNTARLFSKNNTELYRLCNLGLVWLIFNQLFTKIKQPIALMVMNTACVRLRSTKWYLIYLLSFYKSIQ